MKSIWNWEDHPICYTKIYSNKDLTCYSMFQMVRYVSTKPALSLDTGLSVVETSEEEPDANSALELDAMEEIRDGDDGNWCPGISCTVSLVEFGYKKK